MWIMYPQIISVKPGTEFGTDIVGPKGQFLCCSLFFCFYVQNKNVIVLFLVHMTITYT